MWRGGEKGLWGPRLLFHPPPGCQPEARDPQEPCPRLPDHSLCPQKWTRGRTCQDPLARVPSR